MKASLLFLFAVCYCASLQAQSPTEVIINAGSKISDVIPSSEILYYPQFIHGKAFLKDGTQAEARLNYNALFDEMHFIDPKGDTLALADEQMLQFITIEKDTFYYNKGYLRLLCSNPVVKLAIREAWIIGDSKVSGAFGTSGSGAAISSYTSYHAAGSRYGLTVNADISLRKVQQYYLGNQYKRFVPATKKNLMQLFPKYQRSLEMYLKESAIDFTKTADLEKLAQFIQSL